MSDLFKCMKCKREITTHPKGIAWARHNLKVQKLKMCPWCMKHTKDFRWAINETRKRKELR